MLEALSCPGVTPEPLALHPAALLLLITVFDVLCRFVTLYPGDVFLTGTPPGVGVFRKPPTFLKVTSVLNSLH